MMGYGQGEAVAAAGTSSNSQGYGQILRQPESPFGGGAPGGLPVRQRGRRGAAEELAVRSVGASAKTYARALSRNVSFFGATVPEQVSV